MSEKVEMLHKLCDALTEELEDYSRKIERADGMSAGDLEAVDKLSHALKSVKTTIAMMEADDEGGNSYRGENSNRSMPWRGGMSSARRGRGNNPTGRNQYSRDGGYSYAEEGFEMALQEAMDAAPDDRMRDKLKRIMDEI